MRFILVQKLVRWPTGKKPVRQVTVFKSTLAILPPELHLLIFKELSRSDPCAASLFRQTCYYLYTCFSATQIRICYAQYLATLENDSVYDPATKIVCYNCLQFKLPEAFDSLTTPGRWVTRQGQEIVTPGHRTARTCLACARQLGLIKPKQEVLAICGQFYNTRQQVCGKSDRVPYKHGIPHET